MLQASRTVKGAGAGERGQRAGVSVTFPGTGQGNRSGSHSWPFERRAAAGPRPERLFGAASSGHNALQAALFTLVCRLCGPVWGFPGNPTDTPVMRTPLTPVRTGAILFLL